MLIVQISDIHVGPEFREDTFQRWVEEINSLHPAVLMVTGALTENGLLSQFEVAAELMNGFECR
jgi:3',5'-cyclic AMP phosphodiesterase CpdA